MNFLSRLFGSKSDNIECPRCLGKGHVDENDIKRLGKELKWIPGRCAYCNGSGKVNARTAATVPTDLTYLVDNLPAEERNEIIKGSQDAIYKAKAYEERVNDFIDQVNFFYREDNMDALAITEFFIRQEGRIDVNSASFKMRRQELFDYINEIITHSNQ